MSDSEKQFNICLLSNQSAFCFLSLFHFFHFNSHYIASKTLIQIQLPSCVSLWCDCCSVFVVLSNSNILFSSLLPSPSASRWCRLHPSRFCKAGKWLFFLWICLRGVRRRQTDTAKLLLSVALVSLRWKTQTRNDSRWILDSLNRDFRCWFCLWRTFVAVVVGCQGDWWLPACDVPLRCWHLLCNLANMQIFQKISVTLGLKKKTDFLTF